MVLTVWKFKNSVHDQVLHNIKLFTKNSAVFIIWQRLNNVANQLKQIIRNAIGAVLVCGCAFEIKHAFINGFVECEIGAKEVSNGRLERSMSKQQG
jgi:hypothetical protein